MFPTIHNVCTYSFLLYVFIFCRNEVGHIFVLIFMYLSFLPLDLVYVSVVINYCVQCSLLIFFVEGLQTRIMMKSISLTDSRKVTTYFYCSNSLSLSLAGNTLLCNSICEPVFVVLRQHFFNIL